jgi:hypothetical protein
MQHLEAQLSLEPFSLHVLVFSTGYSLSARLFVSVYTLKWDGGNSFDLVASL